jgi:hypothetical protein
VLQTRRQNVPKFVVEIGHGVWYQEGAERAVSFQRSAISFWLSVVSGQFAGIARGRFFTAYARRSSFIVHRSPCSLLSARCSLLSHSQLQRFSNVALQLNPNRKSSL